MLYARTLSTIENCKSNLFLLSNTSLRVWLLWLSDIEAGDKLTSRLSDHGERCSLGNFNEGFVSRMPLHRS